MVKPENLYSTIAARHPTDSQQNRNQPTRNTSSSPPSNNNEKKRSNSGDENEETVVQPKKKKQPEPQAAKTNKPPVSSESQETTPRSTQRNKSNLLRDAPHLARRAAVVASAKLSQSSESITMEDSPSRRPDDSQKPNKPKGKVKVRDKSPPTSSLPL